MANIGGFLNKQTIRDTRGTTTHNVGGWGNQYTFRGDHGRNTFNIGGQQQDIEVHNLGRDDTVNLQGPGWQELPDGNSCDGVLRFYNQHTGSYAEVRTDAGRDDQFVRNRVNLQNSACCCHGGWNNVGDMSSNPNLFGDFGCFGGGDVFSTLAQGMFWNSMGMLGCNPWSFNLNLNLF